jgi:FtsP/CotA-like multicopper oxidase with cupredoxin domain
MRFMPRQPFSRRSRRGIAVTAILLWALFAGRASGQATLEPEGWDAGLRLREIVDLNPDPHIVEINLQARIAQVELVPGQRVDAWTYNGMIPGPLIRVRSGDRLIVHFSNSLPQATTVHWHGVRVPIQMDGVPGSSQPEVKPGESFTYDFVVPDAGLFWYHPHVMSAAQVGYGLYGALLAEDTADAVGVADELVLVLSDIGVDATGHLESPDTGRSTGMAFGREGNIVLVNGRRQSTVAVRAGVPQRWRVVNTAKSRYFNLDLGAGQVFTKIGGDGGLQEYSERTDFVVLAPGERADLIVTPRGEPGAQLIVRSQLFNRGYGSVEARDSEDLFTIIIANMPAYVDPPRSPVRRAIEPLSVAGATRVSVDIAVAQSPQDWSFRYTVNGVSFPKPFLAKFGDTQIWTVTNQTPWSHPIHLHGFFFLVLDKQGEPVHPLEWKDTVSVPFKETVSFIVRFDERAGSWMFHCHILDHADGGLMGTVQLSATGEAKPDSGVEHNHSTTP